MLVFYCFEGEPGPPSIVNIELFTTIVNCWKPLSVNCCYCLKRSRGPILEPKGYSEPCQTFEMCFHRKLHLRC